MDIKIEKGGDDKFFTSPTKVVKHKIDDVFALPSVVFSSAIALQGNDCIVFTRSYPILANDENWDPMNILAASMMLNRLGILPGTLEWAALERATIQCASEPYERKARSVSSPDIALDADRLFKGIHPYKE